MHGETLIVLPAASDPIRIVPIHVPKELSQPAEGAAHPRLLISPIGAATADRG